MTTERDFTRIVRSWLEAGVTTLPDRVLDRVLDEVPTTPQRRRWSASWRAQRMNSALKLGIATAAVIAVAVVGINLLPGDGRGVGGPVTSSSPVVPPPSPTVPSPSPTLVPPSDLPSASPTEVRAEIFEIPFRMTWDVSIEARLNAQWVAITFGDYGGINVLRVERVGADPCQSDDRSADPLQTAEEFMAWLETIPDTTVGPVMATTLGGQPALERTQTVGSLDGCFDTGNLHSGIGDQSSTGGYFMSAFEHARWSAVEVDGQLMAIVMRPANVPTLVRPAQRALETLEFLP